MSSFDDLVARLCPSGVPYRPLADIVAYEQPGRYLVTSTDYSDAHSTPVLTAGQTFVLGHTDEVDGIYPASPEHPVVIFDDFTTAFKWVNFSFKAKSSAMKMLTIADETLADLRYVYYAMQTIRYAPQDHARQWIGTYSKFRVPLPPLDVQLEVVRILDHFMELEAELSAELEARRHQYEHYRTRVFDFPAHVAVRWSTLGEVSAKVSSGGTPLSGREAYYGGDIPWLRTQEVDFGPVHRTSVTITDEGLRNSNASWIPEHCVIVAMYGATAAKVAINEIPLTTNQACCNLQIDPDQAEYRYVFYWIASQYERLKSLGEGSQSNLNARKVKDFPIPIPSLDEQRRIVAMLDQFDALVNDLSIGLPAELRTRRQQYEYYRDKLLTFPEEAA